MSIEIHPRKIKGKWEDGYALDFHTLSSRFVGYNGYGHPEFDTTRSELGELLYKLKYHADTEAVESLAATVVDFLRKQWTIEIDLIVPVPPSDTSRKRQPVLEVAQAISDRNGIALCSSCIQKVKQTPQLKNIYDYEERVSVLRDAFSTNKPNTAGRRLLLFDDLFRSGATMNIITERLIEDGGAKTVYALTLTRTKKNL
ncbi:MAG TPA: hypothetical protein VKF63_06645 [Terracidiphilus sp.]|nr:hypothetical protein [Terracidiphilus sp.]